MICTRTIHHEDDSNRNKSSHRWFEQGQFNTTVRWFVLTHFILSRLHGLRYISAEKPYNIFKNKELDINFFFKFWSACWPFCDQFMWNLFYFYSNWKFLKTGLRPDFCICLLFLCMECTQESNKFNDLKKRKFKRYFTEKLAGRLSFEEVKRRFLWRTSCS